MFKGYLDAHTQSEICGGQQQQHFLEVLRSTDTLRMPWAWRIRVNSAGQPSSKSEELTVPVGVRSVAESTGKQEVWVSNSPQSGLKVYPDNQKEGACHIQRRH